jgi:fatty acid amide hydrolase
MAAITDLSASELVEKITAGELSVQEVTEAHIQHIERVNGKLNAVVIPLFDEARAQAKGADQKRNRGEPVGPLHGVPMTIKEQYQVAGTQTTVGLTKEVGKKYNSDGPLVAKLRQAGGIILGKTNVMQTLAGWESDNPVYGRTNNPWDLDRTPGGSSGGEAAIIAQPGPMARTVADLVLTMGILTAPSQKATVDLVPPVPWRDPAKVKVDGLRIAMYTNNGLFPCSPAIRRVVEDAAEALRAQNTQVDTFTPPDVSEAVGLYISILSADGGAALKHALVNDQPVQALKGTLQGATLQNALRPLLSNIMEVRGQNNLAFLIRNTGRCSAEAYWKLVEARNRYRARFLEALDQGQFDAIICPPVALPAMLHTSSEHLFAAIAGYAALYNLLGMPAGVIAASRVQSDEESNRKVSKDMADITALEVEQGSAGLPVGVQIVARHWREDIVLAVMATLEEHFRPLPTYPTFTTLVD